ncbi:MAG: hypothetical protein QOE08_480 [Thermoleophilaceae bacterium]|nr:hypothetical protein [Thermoleophilaceae bacterium]
MPCSSRHAAVAVLTALLLLALPASAGARVSANTAALQVAMRALHLYRGGIDGIKGPGTRNAVRSFQRRKHLRVDGIAGPGTRRALGRRGLPAFGSRTMALGRRGWDVAALQFLLRRRGYSSVTVDGGFGPGTAAAVRRYQGAMGLSADGLAGRSTQRALVRGPRTSWHRAGAGASGPVRFFRPVHGPTGDGFGMRWGRMHTGIDFPAPAGTRVGAGGSGVVSFAGWNSGGYGNLVIVQHRLGYQSWYAHLSSIAVSSGQAVTGGSRIGYVGSTGHSTGPHLHFEVRINGTPVNPAPYLLGVSLARWGGAHGDDDHRVECTRRQHGPRARAGSGPYATVALAGCG